MGAGHRASLVVFGALALIPARALAQATPSSARGTVTWDAPASCPSAEVVDARIAERVDIPFGDVRVRVTEVDEGVRVDMTADGADRSFVAPTCDDAATAVAVIVALAAHAKLEAEKPAAPPPPPPAPLVVQERSREAPPQPPAPIPATRWSASVASAVDGGSLPRLSPGIAVGAQARRGAGALAVSVSGFLPETERADGDPPVQTTVALLEALVLGCAFTPLHRRVDAGACLGAGLGFMHGRSESIDHPRANVGVRPEGALLARIEWTLPFVRAGGALLRIEGGAIVDPIRRPFQVAGIGDVFRPSAVALRVGAAVDVPFR